jgi:peroxiredoxin
MYENVKMYVNKENYHLEKIITKRQNNTIAEFGLGAIEREITINYLEINQLNSSYKARFNHNFYSDFLVIKKDSPYEVLAKRAKNNKEKFEQSKVTLNKKLLDCEIVDFEGNTLKLNDVKGWLLFDTWNSGCFPCFAMMKDVANNTQEFEKRGIKIVALNTYEQPSDYLKTFCEKQNVNLVELYFFKNKNDITIFKNSLKIFPSIFLISPDKKVVWQTAGKKKVEELLLNIDKQIKK